MTQHEEDPHILVLHSNTQPWPQIIDEEFNARGLRSERISTLDELEARVATAGLKGVVVARVEGWETAIGLSREAQVPAVVLSADPTVVEQAQRRDILAQLKGPETHEFFDHATKLFRYQTTPKQSD